MPAIDFDAVFRELTGTDPFPWQRALYERFVAGEIPASCSLPTGLGKTSVIHVWLLALATNPKRLPRRLVYVVNRRTVVDQTTSEVERLRERLPRVPHVADALWELCSSRPELIDRVRDVPLAISTLRGQFADNREWSADPARPAVICGTVDMIGSRLLFSGYGCGFKTRPLHAGFLGQDALVVHDEAHLEPAFQSLLVAIENEQRRCNDFRPLKVMELTATSRTNREKPFELSDADHENETVRQRVNAGKRLYLHEDRDKTKLADEIAERALDCGKRFPGAAVLVFVYGVEDVDRVAKKLPAGSFEKLTGTLRGFERDGLVKRPIFQRFLPPSNRSDGDAPQPGTVYLVCTSAGEVGVNISADHLACDLSTFESMAQRFGRVNRFGTCRDTEIHVVHPQERSFDDKNPIDAPRRRTLALLRSLSGDASPTALGRLDSRARQEAYASKPNDEFTTSDILFDAWALTTVRDKLPGRPPVEKYLHGIREWEPPETQVAWREEVWELRPRLATDAARTPLERDARDRLAKLAPDLIADYPLKPHELLRDRTDRVFKHIVAIAARRPAEYAWVVDDEGAVEVFTLVELADKDKKDRLSGRTLLLPPAVGGLRDGSLDGTVAEPTDLDVADEWYTDETRSVRRRQRLWGDEAPPGMRRVRKIDTRAEQEESDEELTERRFWFWYERAVGGDSDGSKSAPGAVLLQVHTDDVVRNTSAIVAKLDLGELAEALVVAAQCHDLGKVRKVFQTVLGNRDHPNTVLAKSGKKGGRIEERYRHEFGSLIDARSHEGFAKLTEELQEFVLHVIATHHGRGRPHFPADEAFDPEHPDGAARAAASEVPQRFARLQRRYGRWGLAYLESLLRAADYAASADPSECVKGGA